MRAEFLQRALDSCIMLAIAACSAWARVSHTRRVIPDAPVDGTLVLLAGTAGVGLARTWGSTASGLPRTTTRREPLARRPRSRSARLSSKNRNRARPTEAGLANHGSMTNKGKHMSGPPARASISAGLSCRRSPLRNQWIVRRGEELLAMMSSQLVVRW